MTLKPKLEIKQPSFVKGILFTKKIKVKTIPADLLKLMPLEKFKIE